MARLKSKNNAVCENSDCSYFHKIGKKDIVKIGKSEQGVQRYLCKHCNKSFVETKGTPLYNRKLSKEKILLLCKELVERKGLRAVERTTGIHRDTVGNYLSAFAEHAVKISKYLTQNLGLSTHEMDEFWTFIKKNKKNLTKKAQKILKLVTSGVTRV